MKGGKNKIAKKKEAAKKPVDKRIIIGAVVAVAVIVVIVLFIALRGDKEPSPTNNGGSGASDCFASVSMSETPANVGAFKKQSTLDFPNVVSPDGQLDTAYAHISYYTSGAKNVNLLIYHADNIDANSKTRQEVLNEIESQGITPTEKSIEGFNFLFYDIRGVITGFGIKNSKTIVSVTFLGMSQQESETFTQGFLSAIC